MSLPDFVTAEIPERGPCGICGDPDARHRVLDAIAGMVRGGDDAASVAADYGVSVRVVEWAAEHWEAS